jgi:hypothetical protein
MFQKLCPQLCIFNVFAYQKGNVTRCGTYVGNNTVYTVIVPIFFFFIFGL